MANVERVIVFEAKRDGYSIDQVANYAMTVGELISYLEDYEEDDVVIISHDNGYTFGSLSWRYESIADEDGHFEEEKSDWW